MNERMAMWTAAMRERRYADAWALAEVTLVERDATRPDDLALPYHQRRVWDGRPFEGREVLVRCYHGLGDAIQFARFLPRLAEKAASVTVEVQPRLLALLSEAFDGIDFVPFDMARPLPPREVDIEIAELDFALRIAPEDASTPYLRADPEPLPPGTVALRYGAGGWDHERSIAPDLFAPLCQTASCVTLMPEPTTLAVSNPEGCRFDIEATAGLVTGADLVITVDTMIAHLAGALGKRTWLLLKAEPDWRWPTEGRASAWYPSMRLYHQPHPGDWCAVLAEVTRDLEQLGNARIAA